MTKTDAAADDRWRAGSSRIAQQYWHPHPSFSPDGRFVLFTSNRAGNGDVYLVRVPGGQPETRDLSPKTNDSKLAAGR